MIALCIVTATQYHDSWSHQLQVPDVQYDKIEILMCVSWLMTGHQSHHCSCHDLKQGQHKLCWHVKLFLWIIFGCSLLFNHPLLPCCCQSGSVVVIELLSPTECWPSAAQQCYNLQCHVVLLYYDSNARIESSGIWTDNQYLVLPVTEAAPRQNNVIHLLDIWGLCNNYCAFIRSP